MRYRVEQGGGVTISVDGMPKRLTVAKPMGRSEPSKSDSADQRNGAQGDEWSRNPGRLLMRVRSILGLGFASEGHHPHASHVEAGHAGCQ